MELNMSCSSPQCVGLPKYEVQCVQAHTLQHTRLQMSGQPNTPAYSYINILSQILEHTDCILWSEQHKWWSGIEKALLKVSWKYLCKVVI